MKSGYMNNRLLIPAIALLALLATSCTDETLQKDTRPSVESAILTNQAQVNNFKGADHMKYLVLKGEDITDVTSLQAVSVDSLVIENTGIRDLDLGRMTDVVKIFRIADNASMTRISSLSVTSVNDLYLEDNEVLSDIIGLLNLEDVKGQILVCGNHSLGEDKTDAPSTYGFNVLKHLMTLGVVDSRQIILDDNHPGAVTDPEMIGKVGKPEPGPEEEKLPEVVEISGRDAYLKFLADYARTIPDTVRIFKLDGRGETFSDDDMTALRAVVRYVRENLEIRNVAGWTTNNGETGVFGQHPNNWRAFGPNSVRFGGSLIISACPDLTDVEAFRCIRHVSGDFIIEGCPKINYGAALFVQLKSVDGTFKLSDISEPASTSTFEQLERVGGDLIIQDMDNKFYQMNEASTLKEIGGQLKIAGNAYLNNLRGFEALESVGSIYIADNNSGLDSQTSLPGFDLVQTLLDKGAVKYEKVECYYSTGEKVFFFNPEDDTKPLPDNVTLTGRTEFMEFVNTRVRKPGKVKTLVIDGNDETISDAEMALIRKRVDTVSVDLTVKNVKGWTTNDGASGVFGADEKAPTQYYSNSTRITGGIKFINCPDLSIITGLTCMKKINGDLVVEDCPKVQWNKGAFKNLEEITGTFKVKNITERANSNTVTKLKKVGGDMILEKLTNWFFQLCEYSYLESIGGQLRLVGNTNMNNLRGFEVLKSVQSVYISGNAAGLDSQTTYPGFNLVQNWIDNGIVKKENVECYKSGGQKVTFTDPVK